MSHHRFDNGTEQLDGQRLSLPSEHDCYDHANRCLDMWNDSVDHVARLWLLRMADAWLQMASESDKQLRTETSAPARYTLRRGVQLCFRRLAIPSEKPAERTPTKPWLTRQSLQS